MNRLKNIIYSDQFTQLTFLDTVDIGDKTYRIIDYLFYPTRCVNVVHIWPCLEEIFIQNNIDIFINNIDIINHIETIDFRGKKFKYSYDYNYQIMTSEIFLEDAAFALALLGNIDFILTYDNDLAFKTKDDYNKAYTILSIAGDYIGNN